MKTIILSLLSLSFLHWAQAQSLSTDDFNPNAIFAQGGDPNKLPVKEDPGVDAEVIEQVIHAKTIQVSKDSLSFKWTALGYGAMTFKVIIPELAKHTLFNHRNPGEDGPCLRSFRPFGSEQVEPQLTKDIFVDIEILNRYEINRDKGICKVTMLEKVNTLIGEEEFTHTYNKPMGFRYIEDCPKSL